MDVHLAPSDSGMTRSRRPRSYRVAQTIGTVFKPAPTMPEPTTFTETAGPHSRRKTPSRLVIEAFYSANTPISWRNSTVVAGIIDASLIASSRSVAAST